MGLHRWLSLGMVVFLVVHIATAIAETYVSIDAISAIVPFTSGYETLWVGLGTLAVDLLARRRRHVAAAAPPPRAAVARGCTSRRTCSGRWRSCTASRWAPRRAAAARPDHRLRPRRRRRPRLALSATAPRRRAPRPTSHPGVVMTDIVDLLDAAGLTGRGGAAFSTALKVRGRPRARRRPHRQRLRRRDRRRQGRLGRRAPPRRARRRRRPRRRRRHSVAVCRPPRLRDRAPLRAAGLDVLSVPPRYVSSEEIGAHLAGPRRARPADDEAACRSSAAVVTPTVARVQPDGRAQRRDRAGGSRRWPRTARLVPVVRHRSTSRGRGWSPSPAPSAPRRVVETEAGLPLAGLPRRGRRRPDGCRHRRRSAASAACSSAPPTCRGLAWSRADLAAGRRLGRTRRHRRPRPAATARSASSTRYLDLRRRRVRRPVRAVHVRRAGPGNRLARPTGRPPHAGPAGCRARRTPGCSRTAAPAGSPTASRGSRRARCRRSSRTCTPTAPAGAPRERTAPCPQLVPEQRTSPAAAPCRTSRRPAAGPPSCGSTGSPAPATGCAPASCRDRCASTSGATPSSTTRGCRAPTARRPSGSARLGRSTGPGPSGRPPAATPSSGGR